ncbi:MAG: hypothetical protein ACREQ7_00520 [Candidatus Binatia bacterium]
MAKAILWIGAAALVGYFVWWLAPEYFNPEADPSSQEFLSKVAAEINRSVPVMIDPETELMPAVGTEGMLIYNYRLVSYSAAQLNHEKFRQGARQRVTQAACSTPETRDGLLKKGVTLRYSYFDKDRQPIASIDVTPSDCGF